MEAALLLVAVPSSALTLGTPEPNCSAHLQESNKGGFPHLLLLLVCQSQRTLLHLVPCGCVGKKNFEARSTSGLDQGTTREDRCPVGLLPAQRSPFHCCHWYD